LTQDYSGWRREDASSWFAFNEVQMGVSGFGPALHINLDEFERRLREGVQRTGTNAPSKLPRISDSSSRLPHPALSGRAPNTLERARTKQSTEPFDVRPSPQSHLTPGHGTSIADAEDPRALDVDDFRRWWRQSLTPEGAENRSPRRKLTRMAIALEQNPIILYRPDNRRI